MTDEADSGKRQARRDSLCLSAQLSVAGAQTVVARIRNLSAGGMLVDLDVSAGAGVREGDPVEGQLRGVGAFSGMVAWTAPGQAGIAFDEQIDPKLARTPIGAKATTPAYYLTAPTKRPAVRSSR